MEDPLNINSKEFYFQLLKVEALEAKIDAYKTNKRIGNSNANGYGNEVTTP